MVQENEILEYVLCEPCSQPPSASPLDLCTRHEVLAPAMRRPPPTPPLAILSCQDHARNQDPRRLLHAKVLLRRTRHQEVSFHRNIVGLSSATQLDAVCNLNKTHASKVPSDAPRPSMIRPPRPGSNTGTFLMTYMMCFHLDVGQFTVSYSFLSSVYSHHCSWYIRLASSPLCPHSKHIDILC